MTIRILSAAILCGGLVACGGAESTPSKAATHEPAEAGHGHTDLVQLDTAAIRLGGILVGIAGTDTTTGLAVTGTITYDANRVSHIGARTPGRLVAVRAELGARVSRGALLARLESTEVAQLRVGEREATALVRIARENYEREERLEQQGISSRKELLVADGELRRAEAALHSTEARLRLLGAVPGAEGGSEILSPVSGVVVARHASLGEMATSDVTLFTVADLSHVWIELDIFERDLARVRRGQAVTVIVAAYPGRTFPGRIVVLGETVEPATRTTRARVEIPNADGALKPGMFASGTIHVTGGQTVAVAVVPRGAVQEIDGRRVVFVPGERAGEFRPVVVELGQPVEGDRITIRSGLASGARVVTAGAFVLRTELQKDELAEEDH